MVVGKVWMLVICRGRVMGWDVGMVGVMLEVEISSG